MAHTKSYSGTYMGEVKDVNDPEKRCRVRVNVFSVFDGVPVSALPWANFVMPLGSRAGEGVVTPVQNGDLVLVQFMNGDSRRPLVLGSAQAAPGGKVNLAPEACQGGGQFAHKRTDKQPAPSSPPYYEDVVFSQNRALIQLCRSGNIRITQMDSGSAVELLPDGKMVIHCEGDMFASVKGDTLVECDGKVKKEIKGDLELEIEGALKVKAASTSIAAAGGSSMSGNFSMVGNLSCEGNVGVTGTLTDSGGNTNHHSH